ncbi:MAG: DUF5723 family protein [Patiriisocius sp.]|uniref:DUF5723 family protein n=1 Tax=Patiriisocius sp. TaxID=2822396 RepID=UPI003EF8A2DF
MKILFFYIVSGLTICVAQNKQVLYEWENPAQSLLLNPGTSVEAEYHYGIPFLSQIHINAGSSGVSVFDIFGEDGRDINDKIREKIFELDNKDFFTVSQQLELFNFGWRSKNDTYFSGGIYQELDVIAYFPKDFAILAWEGNRDYLGYEFDFGDINLQGDLLTVYHFGINKKLNKKLTVGLRLKVYSSMLSFRSTNNGGTFTTTQGEGTPNVYEHTISNLDLQVETSGYASLRDAETNGERTNALLGGAFFGGNLGVGIDAGVTYAVTDKIEATASVLDLGAIFHRRDTENYRASGNYTLDGIELIFPEIVDGQTTFPYYSDLEDEVEREIPIDTLNNSYSQFRPAKINAGLTYNFGRTISSSGDCDCRNMGGKRTTTEAVGIQYYNIFRPKGPQMAGTIFYRKRFGNWLSTKATYTVDSYSAKNIGLGVSLNLGNINFYVAADNLLDYGNIAKAKSVSLQLGFNVIVDQE